MLVSRIALALTLAFAPLSSVGVSAAMADDAEEVVAPAPRAKLPTEAELAKAKAEAAAKPAAPVVTTPLTTAQQIALWHSQGSQAAPDEAEVTKKRQIHGEAGVSIGTGGYRSAYVASVIPIGETGTLGIAIGKTDFGKYGSPYMDYYNSYYDGYSGDYYGSPYGAGYSSPYGRRGYGWSPRGGSSQSLAISLDMTGNGRTRSDTSACSSGFRDGERLVEPLWVTQMRGTRSCETTTITQPK